MGYRVLSGFGMLRVVVGFSMMVFVMLAFGSPASAGDMSTYNRMQVYDNMRLYQGYKNQQAQLPKQKRTDTEVMDYHFSFGRNTSDGSTRKERAQVAMTTTDEIGPLPRGQGLYVRWKVKSTGKVYEDAVNLEPLLPSTDQNDRTYIPEGFTISFKVKGPKLYVYLHTYHGETRQIYPVSIK